MDNTQKSKDTVNESYSTTRCESKEEFSGLSLEICSSSASITCRICQDSKNVDEVLISPCNCTGSMGLFHKSCLEIWLRHSQSNKCEICKFEFKTERIKKPFRCWLRDGRCRREKRYFLIDSICFAILTPLGFTSSWLCIQGAQEYYETADKWTGFGLIMLSTFLLLMYLFWASITFRYHMTTFRRWQSRNEDVRIVFENHSDTVTQNQTV